MAAVASASCGGGGGGGQCPASPTPEPAPRQVDLEGGVPIAQLTATLAVARCNYLSRCFGLATYVANECVDALTSTGAWSYQLCGQVDGGPLAGSVDCSSANVTYDFPSGALLDAVNEGVVRYDAEREGQCIAALLAEGCNSPELFEEIPACAGVFTCPGGADGGETATADGASDGGSAACSAYLFDTDPVAACATDQDCAGITGYPEGPHCVGGICAASACGFSGYGCVSYAGVGQPCQGNAISFLIDDNVLSATESCAPGLACQGQTRDGGLGTCAVPQDVGGKCSAGTECKPGLVCGCGVCEIPPSTGPCVAGTCEMGVAYCDFSSNTCRPGQRPGS